MIPSAEEVLAVAREHGLRLLPEPLELDDSGADFVVLHARDEHGTPWVVRTPRRADVLERAATERLVLKLVRTRLPVAVPEWRVFSPRVIAYPRLGGYPAASVDLDAGGYVWRFDETAPPRPFLESLADSLAALHGIPPDEAQAGGLRLDPPAQVRHAYADRMGQARRVLEVPEAVWRRWQAWIEDDASWPESSVPVHGDLHPPHILLDDTHRVVGLLDWTEAHIGDAATDFALLYASLGGAALVALLERYGASGGRVWPRMRQHVVEMWSAYPAVIAAFAMLSGEDAHRQLAQSLVDANAAEITHRGGGATS